MAKSRNKTTRSKPKGISNAEWARYLSVMTDEERAYLLALADEHADVPMTFVEFVNAVRPNYTWYEYNIKLANVLQLVADGYYPRVLVFMPPRLGKSELVSRLFSAYYLYRHPSRWVALTSYGADLAYGFSRVARDNYVRALGTGDTGGTTEAVKHWETEQGGGMFAAGVRGPMTGKGAHLLLIDDPVKDEEEASSEVIQTRNMEWFDSVAMTRLEKGASVVIIQTRWNQLDLSGQILAREDGDAPEHWHIVCFPAEYTPPATFKWPATATIEPDWRTTVGETVCPDRLVPATLAKTKLRNPYVWNALYQQNPTPPEGGMFKREWFEIIPGPPPPSVIVSACRRWDHAGTEGGGDYTVGVKMYKTTGGTYVVADVVRVQKASGARDALIKQTATMDREIARVQGMPQPTQIGAQEPGSAGKDAIASFRRLLDGFIVVQVPESANKELRAQPLASAAFSVGQERTGRIKLVSAPWNEVFLSELAAFPYGTHDDIVDAVAGAYNFLATQAPPRTDLDARTYPSIKV